MEKIAYILKSFIAFLFYRFFMLFKIDNRKIVVANYYGLGGYSDNPKFIIQEILKQKKNIKIIWLVRDLKFTFPKEIEKKKYNSISSLYDLATAKVWIDNQRKSIFIKKRKNQLYIQTWHGCLGFKKIELDAISSYKNKRRYLAERQHDTKMIDYFISGAKWFSVLVRRAFLYNGDILSYGLPRNDALVNNDKDVMKLKNKLNINKKTKVFLYAPTFRNDETSLDAYDLDYLKVIRELENVMNTDVILLIRLHPRLRKIESFLPESNKIINVTDYDDIQDLLLLSDAMITDYSSCIFDFALQMKPAFIYASDIENYKNDRDFYFNFDELPFSLSQTTDELIENINNFNYKNYILKLNNFFKLLGVSETGEAASLICSKILEFIQYS